jgi:glycosyltransferase involved in cell wall biosynthesis
MALFSIIIPLYNKELFIEETLSSVLNQSFTDFEVIIINDGSTDNSYNIIQTFKDDRIQILNQENRGLSASRNIGIKTAKGKFIAFLDADDLWMEDFLETIHFLINNHKKCDIFATNVKLLFPNNTPNLIAKAFDIEHKKVITNFF